jgi:hypothetical protein
MPGRARFEHRPIVLTRMLTTHLGRGWIHVRHPRLSWTGCEPWTLACDLAGEVLCRRHRLTRGRSSRIPEPGSRSTADIRGEVAKDSRRRWWRCRSAWLIWSLSVAYPADVIACVKVSTVRLMSPDGSRGLQAGDLLMELVLLLELSCHPGRLKRAGTVAQPSRGGVRDGVEAVICVDPTSAERRWPSSRPDPGARRPG